MEENVSWKGVTAVREVGDGRVSCFIFNR